MTDPTALLATSALRVEPGGRTQTTITIGNHSEIVEGFHLDVLGEGVTDWAEVTPAVIQVYPGQQGTAVVSFSAPPGNAAASGSYPFGVRISYGAAGDQFVLAEGDVEVGRIFGLNAKITPVTSTGRWRGRHLLTLTNWGNADAQLAVSATDPDERLAFLVLPDRLTLPVGASASAQVQVRTRRPFLRGPQTRLPFQVLAEPDPPDATPPAALAMLPGMGRDRQASIDAAFLQKPILSRFVVTIATLLLTGVVGTAAWVLTRPVVPPSDDELSLTPPESPGLQAIPLDSQTIRLSWNGQRLLDSYKLYPVSPDGQKGEPSQIDANTTIKDISGQAPNQTYCFVLQAVRGVNAALSNQACATTDPTPVSSAGSTESTGPTGPTAPTGPSSDGGSTVATATSPGGGTGGTSGPDGTGTGTGTGGGVTPPAVAFEPGQFVSVIYLATPAGVVEQGLAEDVQSTANEQLAGTGRAAEILLTSEYPNLKLNNSPLAKPAYLVYVGNFSTATAAQTFCSTTAPGVGGPTSTCYFAEPNSAG